MLTGNIEPIPPLLVTVIDHLIQWQLIPEYKRPNGCLVNFFEEVLLLYSISKPRLISLMMTENMACAVGRVFTAIPETSTLGTTHFHSLPF